MDFKEYINELNRLYSIGNTTEHSFRGSLQSFLSELLPGYVVTNEPRRQECGAPDYVITKKGVPMAFFEAKDIDDGDLDGRKSHKEQFNRYKVSLDGIIFTDYLDFHLYVGGEFVDAVRIAETRGNHIVGIPENYEHFEALVNHLVTKGRQRITSSAALARQMAGKAHLLAEVVAKTIALDGEDSDGEMATQLRAFRDVLIHDLKAEEFADIYAQTIVYGMFTARLYDTTPEDFSRQEAANLIPKSNPFLRRIFQSIAGYDIDSNIEWIVDDLAAMFSATDAAKIMANYGSNKRHSDPIVHFYEDFLAEYDPKLRKARGVWYTPAPVVKFIVKSVDEILQTEFGLPMGLADSSTIKVKRAIEQSRDKRTTDGMKHEEVDVHRVQILDPATGTGTFLAEVIQQVRDKFDGMEGMWPSYVEKSLIPRIHGFEILMASYTIAHLKLALTLKNTGYDGHTDKRLNVFLTNSLEEATPRATTLFAKWLSDEADAASLVKTETPIMITLGNPPYSGASQNKGTWIAGLMESYKKEPGGTEALKERNPKWLNDDYVKFIRLAQHYIERNGEGIVAFINPHGYLDNPTFRGMRWNLLKTFDKIYTIDLHGNSKKKETCPDGSKDENVFDIMQGVSINLFVKTGKKAKDELGKVYHKDLYGLRQIKYDFLDDATIESIGYKVITPQAPMYFFVPKDFGLQNEYNKGFIVSDLFVQNSMGVTTGHDKELVSFTPFNTDSNTKYFYRPFDNMWLDYDTSKVIRPRETIMRNLQKENIAICLIKINSSVDGLFKVFVTSGITDKTLLSSKDNTNVFPLYICKENMGEEERIVNFNKDIYDSIAKGLNYLPCYDDNILVDPTSEYNGVLYPQDLFDYIYAVLYSPSYRERYKEFLKIDFPRIPYPKDAEQFHRHTEKGAELRKLHLMENVDSWKTGVTFPVSGTDIVEFISFTEGKVYINKEQYFGNVSELAWNFYIGGYQPAQKWLKDRKGRTLDFQDILHYGHIIYALQETDRIMKEIDEIGVV